MRGPFSVTAAAAAESESGAHALQLRRAGRVPAARRGCSSALAASSFQNRSLHPAPVRAAPRTR